MIGLAGYLCVEGKPGWGWFLFAGFLVIGCIPIPGLKSKD
jgi:hypothetical protein